MLTLDLVTGESPPDAAGGRQVNSWRDETGAICARLFSNGAARWIDWPGLGVFGFEAGAQSVRLWPTPGARSEIIADTFGRVLQPAILQALGYEALHASAVDGPDGILAFCGAKQSGKSTLAYALRRAGFPQFADDALVISLNGNGVVAHKLPFAPRLRPSSRVHFGAGDSDDPARTAPRRSAPTPLAALFVLTQDGTVDGPPRLERISAARAFSALLTHAHCFDLADKAEARRIVEDYLEAARRVPVFGLTYRPRFERLPELVEVVVGALSTDLTDFTAARR